MRPHDIFTNGKRTIHLWRFVSLREGTAALPHPLQFARETPSARSALCEQEDEFDHVGHSRLIPFLTCRDTKHNINTSNMLLQVRDKVVMNSCN